MDPLNIESIPRDITDSDIVFLGCSYTSGVGLTELDSRYSRLISAHYNKKEINLASGGDGNYRSFDLFGQLNFVDNGTKVVIQLTELSRLRLYTHRIVDQRLSTNPTVELLTVYNDKFLIYDLIRQLRIVINYCRSRELKLVIWNIARFNDELLDNALETYLEKFPEYVHLDNRLNTPTTYRVDNGTDGTTELGTGHPGPKSNQLIAEKLIAHFDKLYT